VIVGVSGSKGGLTAYQSSMLAAMMWELGPDDELHHGDCVGTDATAHDLALALGCRVFVHPPDRDVFRAFCVGTVTLPVETYRQRNHDIVRAVEVLWAFPEGPEWSYRRSGAWMTVRIARKAGVPVIVVLREAP
jgi:hypothetical protein